jgi:hypothetical protein
MKYQDDRQFEPATGVNEHETLPIIIWGRDRFMSGWGGAEGGYSWAGWACPFEAADRVERWVRRRGDMQYVRVGGDRPRGRNVAHVHVYACRDGHPALGG